MDKIEILSYVNENLDKSGSLGQIFYDELVQQLGEDKKNKFEKLLSELGIRVKTDSRDKATFSNEELCSLYQKGDEEALSILSMKNERLLYSRAYKQYKSFNHKLDLDDLIQFGYLGLIEAANKFDVTKGTKFTTYSVYWIDQKISRGIMDSGYTIRLPVHVFEKVKKIQAIKRSNDDLDEQTVLNNLKETLGFNEKEIEDLTVISDYVFMISSIYAPVGDEGDTVLLDFIEIDDNFDVEGKVEYEQLVDSLDDVLDILTPREKDVIESRYGLKNMKPQTLDEIGRRHGVTRERIRQIESKALRKLKNPNINKKLRGFLYYE